MQHGVQRVNLSQEAKRLKLERDAIKTANYRQLTAKLFKLRDSEVYTIETFNETTQILLLNPEFYTMWNYRRDILIHLRPTIGDNDYVTYLNKDLKLVLDVLKRYPKCYWIWNHRRWCLFELEELGKVNWEYEFGVVSKLLEMDERNYHGWQYRRVVVKNIEDFSIKNSENSKDSEALILLNINVKEFEYTTSKIKKNISNFSAFHNRSKLIPKLFQYFKQVSVVPDNLKELHEKVFANAHLLLVHELELIKTGMYMDVDDSSVWLYLRWLLSDSFFVEDLTKEVYISILKEQLSIVEELNQLEKEDHKDHWDHCWCLKTIVFIKVLLAQATDSDILSEEIKSHLNTLTVIDPLRKAKYIEQISGRAKIV
ncbi:geranylgeranyl transferase type II alpha subunit [Scheffersomyces amazonensis]|uniref:geranylgeranyl transferase type II alpha subunit n=1 Tax=Scheffersomyces amazonensis TaxID=1078765 RepID=UPI00315D0002